MPTIGVGRHFHCQHIQEELYRNIAGFTDEDFSAAKYTAEGIYMKFRFSFDHYTARKAMAWWEK